jgi:hypothetical protein
MSSSADRFKEVALISSSIQCAWTPFSHLHAGLQMANTQSEAVARWALEEVNVIAGVTSKRLQDGTKSPEQAMAQMCNNL